MTRAGGFTLISAVFLTLVLVVLGVAIVSLSTVQHTTSAQQIQTVRANYALRTGMEWAIARANESPGNCPAGPTTFGLGGLLSSFTVSVSCTRTNNDLGAVTQPYYTVDVTVTSGAYGSPDYVQRRAQAKVLGTTL